MFNVIQQFIRAVLRLLLFAVGLVFAAFVLAAGLVFTLLLVLWSLLRGRPPRGVKFKVDPRSPFAGMQRRPREPVGEVVDIEAREIPDRPQQLKHDDR